MYSKGKLIAPRGDKKERKTENRQPKLVVPTLRSVLYRLLCVITSSKAHIYPIEHLDRPRLSEYKATEREYADRRICYNFFSVRKLVFSALVCPLHLNTQLLSFSPFILFSSLVQSSVTKTLGKGLLRDELQQLHEAS